MSDVRLLVSVEDEYLDRMFSLVENLQNKGMKVEQVMEKLGIIVGYCSLQQIEKISKIPGILNVERDREYQLAPPDSKIQ